MLSGCAISRDGGPQFYSLGSQLASIPESHYRRRGESPAQHMERNCVGQDSDSQTLELRMETLTMPPTGPQREDERLSDPSTIRFWKNYPR